MKQVQADHPFDVVAIVLLPDHLHCVWELPRGDHDYATRWRRIKSLFTEGWLDNSGDEGRRRKKLVKKGERAVWQRRFYEHLVRDEQDLNRCVDYIHWNPVKHQLETRVRDYPWSSFHRYVGARHYNIDWGGVNPIIDLEHSE